MEHGFWQMETDDIGAPPDPLLMFDVVLPAPEPALFDVIELAAEPPSPELEELSLASSPQLAANTTTPATSNSLRSLMNQA